MSEENIEKETTDDVYEAIEHPAQPVSDKGISSVGGGAVAEVEDLKEDIKEITMDRPTRIALITGLFSTIITILNALFS